MLSVQGIKSDETYHIFMPTAPSKDSIQFVARTWFISRYPVEIQLCRNGYNGLALPMNGPFPKIPSPPNTLDKLQRLNKYVRRF